MKDIDLLKKKLERERLARKQAEQILESKAYELFQANESLIKLNESLEDEVKKRTKDLQRSEEKYRLVVEQASDIIYSTDVNGYFTYINPTGIKSYEYEQHEIIGSHFSEYVAEGYKEEVLQYYINLKNNSLVSDYFEFPIRSKSGSVHWMGQYVTRIEHTANETYFNAVARDITQRKKAEEALELAKAAVEKSEIKYRSVLENMNLGLMEVGLDGNILRAYDRFKEMTGYEGDELVGKNALETFIVEGYEDVINTEDSSRLEGRTGVYEVEIRKKNNEKIWVLISGAPFYNELGEVVGSVGIHYDISDRKQLEYELQFAKEEAIKAQEAEKKFLANMSHEIRTPLNAIIGMTHLLSDSVLDEQQQEFVSILSSSSNILKGLVSDILDLSKIDAGVIEKNDAPFSLKELTSTVVDTFAVKIRDKKISLSDSFHGDDIDWIVSDKQWINQILFNLVSNAIKFTEKGSVDLSVKVKAITTQSYQLSFEISDTGIGISEDEKKLIFDEFKQADSSIRGKYGGTGLGLSIASKLVSLLGGSLDVRENENGGSIFFFTIEVENYKHDRLPSSQSIKDEEDNWKGLKVLVVEDNVMNQKYITTLLRKWHVDYVTVNDGEEAVNKAETTLFDMIFMDLSMPVMNGFDATIEIRKIKGHKKTPIVAMTASTLLSKKELALQSGMTDFLAKPFVPDQLAQIIHKYSEPIEKANTSERFDFSQGLDQSYIHNLYEDDMSYALEMFTTFTEIIDDEVAVLELYFKNKNVEGIRGQVHKIKPTFSMVGLTDINKICEEIENSASSENMDSTVMMFEKMKSLISKKISIVRKEVDRISEFLNQNQ